MVLAREQATKREEHKEDSLTSRDVGSRIQERHA
jgi:hypothetical protein